MSPMRVIALGRFLTRGENHFADGMPYQKNYQK